MTDITLAIHNGHITTTSHAVSQHFGKIHRDVVRAIENLDCSEEFRVRNFAQSSETVAMPNGGSREHKSYSITKDGFVFLAMGFRGKEAAQWKEKYIAAFNAMEEQLRKVGAGKTADDLITTDHLLNLIDLYCAIHELDRSKMVSRITSRFGMASGGKLNLTNDGIPSLIEYLKALPVEKKDKRLPRERSASHTQHCIRLAAHTAAKVHEVAFNTLINTDVLDHKRWILSFTHEMAPYIEAVPATGLLFNSQSDIARYVADPAVINRDTASQIGMAAVRRLS